MILHYSRIYNIRALSLRLFKKIDKVIGHALTYGRDVWSI